MAKFGISELKASSFSWARIEIRWPCKKNGCRLACSYRVKKYPVDYPGKALRHSDIKEIFQASKAKYRLCIADACFSGSIAIDEEAKDQQSLPSNMAELQDARIGVVMSSRQNQMSQETPVFKQGIFSYYLIRGLQGAADLNGDRTITAAEAFLFTKTMVLKKTQGKQIPFISGKNLDKMPLARIRKKF